MQLLDELPVGDLTGKVVVDYGVGAWGFAAVYPRLHGCRQAVGIDISETAIELSRRVSAEGSFRYGEQVTYLVARGGDLLLGDDSVDVFFTGECIEHVEDTEAFLDEIHRVLKPDGILILTTPNADAVLYRARGERYCVGIEHVALMGWDELRAALSPGFEVEIAWGFNNSMLPERDPTLDKAVASAWAAEHHDRPDLASGVIVLARPRAGHRPRRHRQHYWFADAPGLLAVGSWVRVPLGAERFGRSSSDPATRLAIPFVGERVVVNLWCHSWGGRATVEIDGQREEVELYSPVGGLVRHVRGSLGPGPHLLQIMPAGTNDPRSAGAQVIFFQAVVVQPFDA